MDEDERTAKFCRACAMAQRVLDMANEAPIHTGMAMDEARKQLAIAFKLFPVMRSHKFARTKYRHRSRC